MIKPYYQDKQVTIYNSDCREILPQLEPVDLVLTDPPYGIDLKHNNGSRLRGHRPYDRHCPSNNYTPVAGDDAAFSPVHLLCIGNIILWGANHYADKLPVSHCWLAWDRKTERGADSDITDCELAWVRGLPFKTVRLFRHMWAGFQRDSEVGQQHLHPTQKPIALMLWCLNFFPMSKTILDPYCGSGPVLRAAKDLGRKSIGIEIEERYAEIAAKRMQQEVLDLPMKKDSKAGALIETFSLPWDDNENKGQRG